MRKRPIDIECLKCHTVTPEHEYMLIGRCPQCGSEKADWEYRHAPYRRELISKETLLMFARKERGG